MMAPPSRTDWRLLAGYGALSLLAIAVGVVTMVLTSIPTIRWLPNIAAWLAGGLAAVAIARTRPAQRAWLAIAGTGLLMQGATLLGPEQSGVQRWLALGPLFINIAALVLPAAIVALTRIERTCRARPIVATAMVAILALQPDGSQAIAFALASLAWLLPSRTASSLAAVASIGGLAGLALLQPDPLLPVPEVEQILALAGSVHTALAALGVAILAGIPLSLWRMRPRDTAALALSVYTAAVCAAPLFGWFPVPLIGAGMSAPLGLWLGMALLAASPTGPRTVQ